jgi:hypothetical protein
MPAIPEMIAGMARSYGRNDDQAPKIDQKSDRKTGKAGWFSGFSGLQVSTCGALRRWSSLNGWWENSIKMQEKRFKYNNPLWGGIH